MSRMRRELENDRACPPEQVAVWLYQLSMADLRLALGPGAKALDREQI